MHRILSDDDKEFSTAKGVNVAMELKEYKDNQIQNEKNSQ